MREIQHSTEKKPLNGYRTYRMDPAHKALEVGSSS